ncbi:MerR family transcriptional regulator [Erwiniaceae bacterium L1_54_6]|jgi:DNA-binding transcriptional MerR regulator|nr:MerR family transcriptional regulator [Erwiniaceae bacterium L1_54_6]
MGYRTDEVCRLTNLCPEILRNWHKNKLIRTDLTQKMTDSCLADIRVIKALTSSGDTLEEIKQLLTDSWHYRPSGWPARQAELRSLIENHNRFAINAHLRKLIMTYAFHDLKTYLFNPLISQPTSSINNQENYQYVLAMISSLPCITGHPCTAQRKLKTLQQPAFSCHRSTGLKTNLFTSHQATPPTTAIQVTAARVIRNESVLSRLR